MFNKKLSPEDLDEIRERTKMIQQHLLTAQALEMQKNIYVKNLFPKYNLDGNKNYNIDLAKGLISEKKPEPKPKNV